MICRTSEEKKVEKMFRSRLRPYLKVKDSRTVPASSKARARHGEEIAVLPIADVTHLFNHEAMLAASHAIEDLARDTGCPFFRYASTIWSDSAFFTLGSFAPCTTSKGALIRSAENRGDCRLSRSSSARSAGFPTK